MKPLRIGLLNFDPVINQKELPVVLLFYAEWHLKSKYLLTALEDYGKLFDKKLIPGYVEYDYATEIFSRLNVSDVPTIIIFEDGVPVMRKTGYTCYDDMKNIIEKFFGVLPYSPRR